MNDANDQLGTIDKCDGYYKATLTRFIDHDQETVWNMLTDPSLLVEWLAPGSIDMKKGGMAKLNFVDSGIVINSLVTEFSPPHLLEYSWSSPGEPVRPIRWENTVHNGRTALTLTLNVPDEEDVARACAGWEAHLMMLLAALENVSIKFPFERFQTTRNAYNEMI